MTVVERRGVFLDRDGTLIEECHYLSDPTLVRLVPGAAEGIRRLQDLGLAVVVITNQSGIGRGYFTEADYYRVAAEVDRQLSEGGAYLDGSYFCPDAPGAETPPRETCRKPGGAMYEAAQRELKVALRRSYYVGDRVSDVLPAVLFEGQGILVRTGYGAKEERDRPKNVLVADDFPAAVELICRLETVEAPVDPLRGPG